MKPAMRISSSAAALGGAGPGVGAAEDFIFSIRTSASLWRGSDSGSFARTAIASSIFPASKSASAFWNGVLRAAPRAPPARLLGRAPRASRAGGAASSSGTSTSRRRPPRERRPRRARRTRTSIRRLAAPRPARLPRALASDSRSRRRPPGTPRLTPESSANEGGAGASISFFMKSESPALAGSGLGDPSAGARAASIWLR